MKIIVNLINVSSGDKEILKEYLDKNKWFYENEEEYSEDYTMNVPVLVIDGKIDSYEEVPEYEMDELLNYLENCYWKYRKGELIKRSL